MDWNSRPAPIERGMRSLRSGLEAVAMPLGVLVIALGAADIISPDVAAAAYHPEPVATLSNAAGGTEAPPTGGAEAPDNPSTPISNSHKHPHTGKKKPQGTGSAAGPHKASSSNGSAATSVSGGTPFVNNAGGAASS